MNRCSYNTQYCWSIAAVPTSPHSEITWNYKLLVKNEISKSDQKPKN
jgi:hypothetical protein